MHPLDGLQEGNDEGEATYTLDDDDIHGLVEGCECGGVASVLEGEEGGA